MARNPFLAPTPRGEWGRLLMELDPRPKLAFAVLTGLVLWRLPLPVLFMVALLGIASCLALGAFSRASRGLWRTATSFVLVWAGLKTGLDLVGGSEFLTSLGAGADLGLRLSTLMLLGFTLTFSASPRRLGAGLAWYLRPVLGKRAWQVALSLALMIHFLPLSLAAAGGLNQGLSRRWPQCPWSSRIRLVPQAMLRVLSQATWTQTLAVAARNLDQPEAWRPERKVYAREWVVTLVPGLGLVVLSMYF
ncbi:energy-coupling factor transporter transmembrane component T family protein [Desulfonatronum parangueonense]